VKAKLRRLRSADQFSRRTPDSPSTLFCSQTFQT
jgi:hypothetical protein